MKLTRLIFAVIVAVGLAAGAFEHMLGIGWGPGGTAPIAFASGSSGGGSGGRDPAAGQPAAQPAEEPSPEPSGPSDLDRRLKEVEAEIDRFEYQHLAATARITVTKEEIKKLRKNGVPDIKWWEDNLLRGERDRKESEAKLQELEKTKTALVVARLLAPIR